MSQIGYAYGLRIVTVRMEGPLSRRLRRVLLLVGVRNGKAYTVQSCIFLAVGLINMSYLLTVMLFTDSNMTKAAHFLVLQYFYVGSLWTVVSKSGDIMRIANECDKFVGLNSDRMKSVYEQFDKEVKRSGPANAKFTITSMGTFISIYICVEPYLKTLVGLELEYPFTGTDENPVKFRWIYSMQVSLMFVTANMCVVIFTTLMGTALTLVTKYKLLNYELTRLNVEMLNNPHVRKTKLYERVKQCAQHHQHILSIFAEYREIVTYGFRYSYLGLLGATTLSRSLLSGDDPDLGTIPHIIAELSYIGTFCYVLNQLEKENDDLKLAVYASGWADMPKEVTSSFRVILERLENRPHVVLYQGGGPANMDTFYKLLNGTCGYLIFGKILDNASTER